MKFSGIVIHSADIITEAKNLPDYCAVSGIVLPSIGFEMRLPLSDWNGRFLMSGCGAYCGQLLADRADYSNAINFALERGYATTKTDAGHKGSRVRTNWALDNRPAEVLYAHAWVPLATAASRAILQEFYGRRESFAYFSGCSNGGRTALKVAQSYPYLFDGVISGCPTVSLAGAAGLQGLWHERSIEAPDGTLLIERNKIPLLAEAVRDKCDALDGIRDRIVSRPDLCDFDPSTIACTDDSRDIGCLTAVEAEAVRRLYEGVIDENGNKLYPGLPFGSESYWLNSIFALKASGERYLGDLANDFFRHLAFRNDPGEGYSAQDFDLAQDLPKLRYMSDLIDATNAELEPFHAAGGKLLLYHGLADPVIVPQQSISYYESVVQRVGSLESVREFFRLFLIPGGDHCWATVGQAPDLFDPLLVMERWVEQGSAPDRIEAFQFLDHGKLVTDRPLLRTRPLCLYPLEAKYDGAGSPFSAANFYCEEPHQ